jgi:flagellar hook-associated protein 2
VAAGTTLTQLADQINSAGLGVTATTFDTGAGTGNTGRLAVTDDNSGKFNPDQTAGINFNLGFSSTLTGLATGDFGVAPIVEGVDSQVKINGSSTMYRDSNVVTDLIPGVTLNLLSADPGVDKTLTIGESSDNAGTKIADFLNKYNTLLLEIKKAIKIDPSLTAQTNPTAGNSTLRSVMDQLTSVVMSSVDSLPGSRSIRALVDLGVTSTYDQGNGLKNGQLSLDNSKLEAAISSNFEEVVEFFEGVTQGSIKYAGFGEKVSDVLDTILNFSTGTLPAAISASDAEITRLQDDIDKKLAKIDAKEQMLKAKFARLETVLAQLSSQQKSLSSALGSLPSAKKND